MGNLSQAEIDALLHGDNKDVDSAKLTGELDISAYIGGESVCSCDSQPDSHDSGQVRGRIEDISKYFSPEEIDALGEIGNICIGTSATTMNMLIGRKVMITTPKVELYIAEDVLASYKCPFLAISVEFVEGIYGKNLLILKDYDAALITDLLMGGEGVVDQNNIVLTEIHLSAVSEVMNQMIGSAATAMSNMMGDGVNISPPCVVRMEMDENISRLLDGASPILKISFDMEIEGLLKSELLQIMSVDMGKELIASLIHTQNDSKETQPPKEKVQAVKVAAPAPVSAGRSSINTLPMEKQPVKSVKPANYESFDEQSQHNHPQDIGTSNFDLINDIPLQVTVELGKTRRNLSDILNLGVGSMIVLDKQAGENVDVIVNGKRIAKGEVVVIDENYGVRITELVKT